MSKYKPWTDADDAELVLMREARTPTKEIAIALGRTPSAVMNRISAKGIPYGKEPTFREVVDTAFAKLPADFGRIRCGKHGVEFGEPDGLGKSLNDMGAMLGSEEYRMKRWLGDMPEMLNQMERDIKRKPQWYKAMMWWRK